MTNDLSSSMVHDLDASLDGRVIRPDEPGYDEARQVFYGGHDLHPAIVVRAASDDDIVRIHEQYVERRSIVAKVVGAMMDDDAGRDLYLGYAEKGRSALLGTPPGPDGCPEGWRAFGRANTPPVRTSPSHRARRDLHRCIAGATVDARTGAAYGEPNG